MTVLPARARGPSGRASHYVVPVLLAALLAVVVGVVLTDPFRSPAHRAAPTSYAPALKLPPYYVVRSGDTLSQISARTRLSLAQLEAFNPQIDPENLLPGQRLNLWRHPPVPKPPPPPPMFYTVRPGESFGSIANKTGLNIVRLEQLNPNIPPASIQAGQRLRLRG
jgi:LysM repeat protein